MDSSGLKMSLKLLVDQKSCKVLFAEADKAFVDFLLTVLALPIGTVTSLLKENGGMVGSLGTLYRSIESLSDSYMVSDHYKDAFLHPKVALCGQDEVPLLKGVACVSTNSSNNKAFYKCSYCTSSHVTDQINSICSNCGHCMGSKVIFPDQSSAATTTTESAVAAGYVKGVVTYMVMDDLTVKPMSTISSLTMLNTFKIRDVGALEEKNVILGMPEALKLLKASLHSKTVLTDVFLH